LGELSFLPLKESASTVAVRRARNGVTRRVRCSQEELAALEVERIAVAVVDGERNTLT